MSPASEQLRGDTLIVTAVAGHAYGVIGADIHIFGSGTPVYLLFEHHRVRNSDPSWLRAQPSRMLDARGEVVEFTGREAALTTAPRTE